MSVVSIELLPLPQAENDAELFARLRSVLTHDIPGFVILHAEAQINEEFAISVHLSNVLRVESALQSMHPKKLIIPKDFNFGSLGQEEAGLFHNDMISGQTLDEKTLPLVHTTLVSGGDVYVAAVGDKLHKVFNADYGPGSSASGDPEHPHSLLLDNKVNTDLTSPIVYKTKARPGVTIVMADSGRHSAWHRFDTEPSPHIRKVRATVLRDKTMPERRYGENFIRGFDIAA